MESLFDNLLLHEIVLLFLGVFLFGILCLALMYYIVKKEEFKKLIWFFPVAIVMIAYPSIQEIQIEKDKISLTKYKNDVLENPEDTTAREALEEVAQKLEKRASSVEDLKALSEANLILGNSDKVIDLTNKAMAKTQELPAEKAAPAESAEARDSIVTTNEVDNSKFATLHNIQELAIMQKEIKNNPAIVRDTAKLEAQIKSTAWNNPKTKLYLNKQILNQKIQVQ